MKKIVIGIDVSKLILDICIQENGVNRFDTIANTEKAIKSFLKQFVKRQNILIGMENTGRFNTLLYNVLIQHSFAVYVINTLHLKKSMGLVRGKNDKIDSERIAVFYLKIIWIFNSGSLIRKSLKR
ncbi:transposase [Empedobacter stercoris]|uniref:Transposase n=1 Tax=Empedobacter stercoris TaxID=1628248 RepID=A0ABX1WJW8_9FLAO|nr:transposase [Empedobacter stercoris]MCA4809280.1 transposase [Empedobacter stercoris]NOJ74934.1 transposase [Empedobacter stercoris]QNT13746.1 transposase [Empedobacter stercoris]